MRLLFAGSCPFTLRRQRAQRRTAQKGGGLPGDALMIVFWLLSLGVILNATPLTWNVDATLTNAGVVTGSFQHDSSTLIITNLDLKTTQDGPIPPKAFNESIYGIVVCGYAINVFDSTGYELSFSGPFPAIRGTEPLSRSPIAQYSPISKSLRKPLGQGGQFHIPYLLTPQPEKTLSEACILPLGIR